MISLVSIDKLVGTLQSYEVKRLNEEGESRGKKMIALKSNYDSNDTDSEDEDEDNEEMTLMVKKWPEKEENLKGKDLSNHLIKRRTSMKEKITKM